MTDRYFRGITVGVSRAPHFRTHTDVVVTGPADTRPDLFHGAQRRAEEEFGLKPSGYSTTWFDLSPDVLVPLDAPPLPVFWTLAVGWMNRSGGHGQCSVYGESLALPHDTRSGLLAMVRRMNVKEGRFPENHGVLSFSCGPGLLSEAR